MGENRKSFAEMAGETRREIAVLVAVFFLLDNLMEGAGFSIYTNIVVMLACTMTLVTGMLMELYRN